MISLSSIAQNGWASIQEPSIKSTIVASVSEAWEKVKPYITDFAVKTAHFLRTAPGIGLLALLGAAALAISAEYVSDNTAARVAMKICAMALFVGAGVVLGVGFVNGMTVPLF